MQDAKAEIDGFAQRPARFDTERFIVVPLAPMKVAELLGVLLQDEPLAEQLPWMTDKSADGALREAFLLELQCMAGATRVWGIVERARGMFIGAAIASNAVDGIDLQVLCASQFWDRGVADEVGPPVADWLDDNALVTLVSSH
jgi:hypothetical protein